LRDTRVGMAVDSGGPETADPQPRPAAAVTQAERARLAEEVRRHAEDLARPDVQALAYWMRPEDVGMDQLSEFVGAGFRRLAHDLAFAMEMDTPDLFSDEIVWLVGILDVRGYDPRQVVTALQIFEMALAAVCPSEVLALARPIMSAGHQIAAQTVAELHPEFGP
jgi:hypothetical protein